MKKTEAVFLINSDNHSPVYSEDSLIVAVKKKNTKLSYKFMAHGIILALL